VDTFKETEANAGRPVRGRQILFRIHNYFATNAQHGAVYDMEDLLSVTLLNENLLTFMRNWDTVLSGIPKTPEASFLEPLFHRQVKKVKALSHDINIYERALEGSKERSYSFLYDAANAHLNRKRLERNRERMARQTGDQCKYKHQTPVKGRGGIPAAVCLLSALVAGSATQADAFSLRKEWTDQITNCTYPYSLALPAVNFSSEVDYLNIPVSDPNARFTPISPTNRKHRGEKPLDFVPETRADSIREAQMSAKMLKASISTKDDVPACRWECDSEIGCNHCIPKGLRMSCPAKTKGSSKMLNLEWIGDTGSAQDLIAERDLQHLKAYESEQPINIMTANGPSSADKQCDVDVPSIAISAKPYVLPDTPSVLSIGQRCMEQGFDFIWRACTRPYLKTPEGERVFLDVRDNVPFLKSWKEGTACPARESKSDEIQSVARGEMPDRSSEEIALQLLEKHDFSVHKDVNNHKDHLNVTIAVGEFSNGQFTNLITRSEGAARVRAILDGSRPAPPSDEVRAEPDIGPPAPAAADAPDGEDSRLALVVKDVATCFMYAYPAALKSEDECLVALQHFASAKDNVETFYSDKSRELEAAAKTLGWRHELSKAYIHQSNAVAERAVRATTEGTRTNLIQAGISQVYWPFALEHACTAYNISNPGGKEYTPWFKRFGVAFPEEPLPFGCRIDVWVGPKAQRKGRDRFEPTSEPAIFMGYKFQPGMKWRKEVFAIHLKQLNKHDFHECLKPVIASQYKLTDGKIVFPMRERYERVQAGLASDATEGPVSQSLTNQDAEAADEQPPAPADREVEPPKKVLDPKTGKEIDLPEGGRYYDSGGTLGRKYGGTRGSKKPESIPSYLWVNMSKKQKEKAIVDEAREQALRDMETPTEGSAGSSSAAAAAAPAASKDHWEVRLNECKLIRYHYVPRREMFSPDITDCPIELSRISKQRSTTIIPVGGVDVIHEDDDWKNVRKRNKKTSFKWIGKTEFILDRIHSPAPDGDGKDAFPAMPTVPHEPEHREKISSNLPVSEDEVRELFALVARPVGRREILEDPKAQAALDVEWNKLMVKKAWDMGSVREWKDVSDEAIKKGKKVHVGKVFEICVEKGSELPKGDPQRKFKGRTVFQGNNVKDENSDQALFSELGSSPATMEAGKALDAYGHAPGNDCQQADGKQAYTQTTLKGKETWVRLPPDRWPSEWKGKYKDPVVRLTLALYGHPDSGGFWELRCEKMLGEVLTVMGEFCNAFFFVELCLRLWCYRSHFFYGEDYGWNLFDSFLVVSSVLDVILTYTAADISPALAASMKMLKLFRIMRVFRVFRFFRELGNWAMMIIDSLKSLFGALILLGIIVYVFAVSLSMNTADWLIQQDSAGPMDRGLYEEVDNWFGSLGSTVYTLMLSILGGVSWHIVCDVLFKIDILSACLLLFYIMFTIFSVLNVITGVFVDSAIQTTNSQRDIQIERELELKDSFLKSLKDFFEALDTDGNGAIHLDEIKIMLQDPTLAAYFAVLGFDEVNAHQIFHLLDDDESGEVSIQEFLDGCAKLKGQARSIDVHAIMHQCRALHRDISFVGSQLGVDLHQAAHASRQSHWFGRNTQTSVLTAAAVKRLTSSGAHVE
ncbi:NaCP60E, partial [Symbiodinium natans]